METEIPQSPVGPVGPIQLGPPEPELFVSHRWLTGAFAMWAISLNPIFPPRNLINGLTAFHEATKSFFVEDVIFNEGHTPTIIFQDRRSLRAFVEAVFDTIPEIQDWNKTQNEVDGKVAYPPGHSQFQIVSSFDPTSPAPENDFVDLGALANNIANYFHFDAERSIAFNKEFAEQHPEPPPISQPYPIVIREDGELPTEQLEETFMVWLNRTAEKVPMQSALTETMGSKWVSRVDGGYMGITPDNFVWLYKAGIRERIQMMDAEEGKTACIGFNPAEQKWYGWSRACAGFGIGSIAEEGDSCTKSGWDANYLIDHPEKDFRVPVGFEAKTLVDAKRMAIAFAESLS